MRKGRITDEGGQWLQQARRTNHRNDQAGMPTAGVCCRHGLSRATFYKLKSRYGGMEMSEAARLKALEDKNAKLKRLLAEMMLDNVLSKDLPEES